MTETHSKEEIVRKNTEHNRRAFLKQFGIRAGSLAAGVYMLNPLAGIVKGLFTGGDKKSHDPAHTASELEHAVSHAKSKWDAQRILAYGMTANFAFNIANLARTHDIHWSGYPSQWGLLGAKYATADEAGKHHIAVELKEGWDALRVIGGTMIAGGEAVSFNLDEVTKRMYEDPNRVATKEETLFILAALAPLTSSTLTTVGSSTMFRSEVNNLVDKIAVERFGGENKTLEGLDSETLTKVDKLKKDIYCDMIAHVSDNSGFMFLGDPPFIAMAQKYGAEGFLYQNRTMWAPMLYSSARMVMKMSKYTNPNGKMSLTEAAKIMTKPSHHKLFWGIMRDSGLNFMRTMHNFFGHDEGRLTEQDPRGMMIDPFESLERKLVELGYATSDFFKQFKNLPEKKKLQHIVSRFSAHNIKHTLEERVGPNLADVLTVFPYQAISIPGLQTAFEDYLGVLDGLPHEAKDAAVYLSIAAASSLADNYVACKIGLNLKGYEERPEIILAASIIGGSLLPPGNMANMALVDQSKYGIGDGLKRLHKHLDMLGLTYGYVKAIPYLREIPVFGKIWDNSGILRTLEKDAQALNDARRSTSYASVDTHRKMNEAAGVTRRGFMGMFRKG